MLEHGHWAPPHRWPLWKWPIKPSFQTTIDLFTRGNLKPTPKPKRNTLIQALTDSGPLKIAVRDRLYTRCEWGQQWGHNSIFSGCNCHSRALSKCFLEIRIVSKLRQANIKADPHWLPTAHRNPFTPLNCCIETVWQTSITDATQASARQPHEPKKPAPSPQSTAPPAASAHPPQRTHPRCHQG